MAPKQPNPPKQKTAKLAPYEGLGTPLAGDSPGFWLVKSEPFKYSWDTFVREGGTPWNGVRNYQARNYLLAMQPGEKVLFYHSNEGKAVVGVATVSAAAYPGSSAENTGWVMVDLVPDRALAQPVPLALIKNTPELAGIGLLRQPRLWVMPLAPAAFQLIVELGQKPA